MTRTRYSIQEAVYWHNVMLKDNEMASTAPANLIYTYKVRLKGFDAVLPQDVTISNPYIVGDAVWIKILHGRFMMQFDRGTVMRICRPHSVCANGIPHHVKDVHHTASDHVTPLNPSDDEAHPMVYKAAGENSASNAPGGLKQDEFIDTSEDNVSDETVDAIKMEQ